MLSERQIRRRRILREAEGYLGLAMLRRSRIPEVSPRRARLANLALKALARLDATGARCPAAAYLRGEALRMMDRYREAAAAFERATDLNPMDPRGWLALGWCYKRMGRLDLAIEALGQAQSVDPIRPVIHYNLACYWSLACNAELAIGYLARAFELQPAYRDAATREPDFDPIRSHPGFLELTSIVV